MIAADIQKKATGLAPHNFSLPFLQSFSHFTSFPFFIFITFLLAIKNFLFFTSAAKTFHFAIDTRFFYCLFFTSLLRLSGLN